MYLKITHWNFKTNFKARVVCDRVRQQITRFQIFKIPGKLQQQLCVTVSRSQQKQGPNAEAKKHFFE